MLELWKKINEYVPKFIRRNFGRKVLALFFAVLVYFKVSNQIGGEKVIENVHLNFISKGNSEIVAYNPESVDVTIKGFSNRLRLITNSDVKIDIPVIDNPQNKTNSSSPLVYNIRPEDIKLPNGISVVRIIPNQISIHLSKRVSKNVRVEPSFKGELPSDFSVGKVTVTPQTISISGPETIISDIRSVPTTPIYIDESTIESFKTDRKIQSFDKNILTSPSSVQVSVEIYKVNSTRVIQNIPVNIMNRQGGANINATLEQDRVNVTVGGQINHLEQLKRGLIKAFVDVSKYDKPGTYEVKVDCWVDDPLLNVKFVEPATLIIDVK